MYKTGEILKINLALGIHHTGIYVGNNQVIHCSKRTGHVAKENLETFANGREVENLGYPSSLSEWEVIQTSESLIGTPWNLLTFNCQHFVTQCHGQKNSWQLNGIMGLFALVGMVAIVRRIN